MNILFLSRWFPYPPDNGSKIRIFNLLAGLSKEHRVYLLSFYDPNEGMPDFEELRKYCENIEVIPWQPFRPNSSQALKGFFSARPRSFVDTFSPVMKSCIESNIMTSQIEIVVASQIDMAAYAPYFAGLPAVFEEVEVGVLYEQFGHARTTLQRMRRGLTWEKYRRFLKLTLSYFRVCTVVSEREAALLERQVQAGAKIDVVPNCVELGAYSGIHEVPQPFSMIYAGAFTFEPNFRAMQWFVDKVLPRIVAQVPQAHLTITGNHAGRTLSMPGYVSLTGYVDDVHSRIARSWCSVVPLLQGGGTRLKILEAMALGTPVIATSKGAEGLDVQPGEHLLVADEPHAFAEAVLNLFVDPLLRQRLAANAHQLIREKYDWAVTMPRFLKMIESVVG